MGAIGFLISGSAEAAMPLRTVRLRRCGNFRSYSGCRSGRRKCLVAFFPLLRLRASTIGTAVAWPRHRSLGSGMKRRPVSLGHEVRLLPPVYVKPFVKRHKNDMADAEAILGS